MTQFADVKSDYDEAWLECKSNYSAYWNQAETALRASAGDTWTTREKSILRSQGREPIELNLIRPNINFFSGFMRDNIKSVVSAPKEPEDQETADEMTDVMQFVWDKGAGLYTELNAFDHCLNTGMALLGVFMDFTQDTVNGDIRFFKRSYNSFCIDPNFSKINLEDASYVLMRDFLTRDEAKLLLPEIDPQVIDEIPSFFSDNKFNLLRPRENIRLRNKDLISFDSFYRQSTRRVKVIVDLKSGEEREVLDEDIDEEQLNQVIQQENQQGSQLEFMTREKPSIEYNIILSNQVVFSGRDPVNIDTYPFRPVVCYFEPDISDFSLRFQGMSIGLLDGQRIFNKRNTRVVDYFDSSIDGGQYYKPSMLVDPKSIYQSGNYKNIPVKKDATPNDFWPINQGQPLAGTFEYIQGIPPLIQQMAGVSDTLLGQDEGGNTQVSGQLAQVRIASGLRANRAVFDNFEQTQTQIGGIVIQVIQNTYSIEKITRILGKPPTDEFKIRSFERFDSIVKQNVQSQSQRDAYYFELVKLRELLGPEAIPASMIIEALPMVGKSELKEQLQKQEEAAQEQAKKTDEFEELLKQIEVERLKGEMTLNELRQMREVKEAALTRVKISEVEENLASAQLDRAKAIAEIEKISDDRLITVLRFIDELDQRQVAELDIQVQKSIDQAEQITTKEPQEVALDQQQDAALQQQQQLQQPQQPGGL